MMRATGGLAIGATSTRSSPCSIAAASAVSTSMIPSCAPSAAMTLIGLMRICLLTRTRLVVSWIRAPLLEENKNADPFSESARLNAAEHGCVVARTPAAHLEHRGPEGGVIRPRSEEHTSELQSH